MAALNREDLTFEGSPTFALPRAPSPGNCRRPCPPGQVMDSNCNCHPPAPPPPPPPSPPTTCPTGQHKDASGQCVADTPAPPPPAGCPPGQIKDANGNCRTPRFNDPISQDFERTINLTLGNLQQPVRDPRFDEVLALLRQQMGPNPAMLEALRGLTEAVRPDPRVGQTLDTLRNAMTQMLTSQQAKEAEDLKRYREYVLPRVAELRAEPFTETEEKGRRVAAFENLERSRQDAKRMAIEQLGGLGHMPTSGIVQRALADIDSRFDALSAAAENQLLLEGTNIRSNRRTEADRLMAGLPELGLQSQGLQNQQFNSLIQGLIGAQGTVGQLGQGQQDIALRSALGRGQLGLGQGQQNLGALGQFGNLVGQIMGMGESRLRDVAAIAAMLPQLQNENFRLALQLFGQGGPMPTPF